MFPRSLIHPHPSQEARSRALEHRSDREAWHLANYLSLLSQPPNGGGGGIGYASNLHFSNFTTHNNTGIFAITQCTSYNGATGGCDTSLFNIHNISLTGVTGTVADTDVVAVLQCSAASPCRGVSIEGVRLTDMVNGTVPAEYLCDSVVAPQGFGCTGPVGGQNSD